MRKPVLCLLACLGGAVTATPAVRAADTPSAIDPPQVTKARAEIKAKQYAAALAELRPLMASNPSADALTLYGHALWKTGDPTQGMAYYNRALALDPNHKGALEYQGELFVALGQIDQAQANLTKLNHLCFLFGCEEADDLKEAIEHAPRR